MFYYDENGKVYTKVNDKEYQNIGIYVGEDNALTYTPGSIVKNVKPVGMVSTIDELIAKFHVSKDNPIRQISKRNTKK